MSHIYIYSPGLAHRGGAEKLTYCLAEFLARGATVFIVTHTAVDLVREGFYFGNDLRKVRLLQLQRPADDKLSSRQRSVANDFATYHFLKDHPIDLFINLSFYSHMPPVGRKSVYWCMFPQTQAFSQSLLADGALMAAIPGAAKMLLEFPTTIADYSQVVAISQFVKHYVGVHWELQATTLYPYCDDMSLPNIAKRKIILTMGRFCDGPSRTHPKRQDVLLDAFLRNPELSAQGWELHMVGSAALDDVSLAYRQQLGERAVGAPVFFHDGADREEVVRLCNEATVYCHCAGFGTDVAQDPQAQEHFGITTVEAMSAGCVPVVFKSAGQIETVLHEQNGFHFTQASELDYYLKILTSSDTLCKQMGTKSRQRARLFQKQAVDEAVAALMTTLEMF